MKKSLLVLVASAMAVAGIAQPPPSASPEQIAERRTETMRRELDLTEKQNKKVYRIYLTQARKAASALESSSGEGAFPGPGPGGPGGGSMRGGGMPGGGMGGPGGGMAGGGRPPQGDRMGGQRPDGPPARMNPAAGFYEESEKEIALREKKMKKILTGEQFPRWQRMEAEHRHDEMQRRFDRNTLPAPPARQ